MQDMQGSARALVTNSEGLKLPAGVRRKQYDAWEGRRKAVLWSECLPGSRVEMEDHGVKGGTFGSVRS